MTEEILSYTNSDSMKIEVSTDHLEKAVQVKLELQDASSSRRCNWNTHKKIMEDEGFSDSDTNEEYRCLIKRYQKKIGKLHNLPSHVDLIATSKIEAIRKMTGDLRFETMAAQDIHRKINQIKRDMTRTAVAIEELRNIYIDDIDFTVPHYVYKSKLPSSNNKGILIVTDWHIGMKVDNCLGNIYNFSIAEKRINKLIDKTLERCELFNITDLQVVGLGDWIEHLYMRKNQSQDCEFSPSMQTAKAQKLLLHLLISLGEYVNVTYQGIAGNHDRTNGDKTASFDGDNANVIINEGIKDMLEVINSPRINYIHNDPHAYEIFLELNGRKFKFVHGDKDNGNKRDRLKGHIALDNRFYDVFVYGHLHNYKEEDSDHGRVSLGVGCLMGRNNYSKDMLCATDASQAMIVVHEDGDLDFKRINLQIN